MKLALDSESFSPSEDQSWLGSAHGTSECDPITLDGDQFLATFTDGVIPSGTVLAKRTSDSLYIPYVDTTVATATITRTATGGTVNAAINGDTSDDFAVVAATTAAQIQTALRAISPLYASVTVAGVDGGPFTVTFTGVDGDVNFVIDDSDATGGTVVVADVVTGGGESPAGEGTAAGHLFTTIDLGGTTAGTVGNTSGALYWHGEVIEANLPTGHGLTASAKADLKHIRYV